MEPGMRRVEQFSPKSSPGAHGHGHRGARSPVVPRQDSSGTLKTTISLGKTPAIVHHGPFYLMKEPPSESERTGALNLIFHEGLDKSYDKICLARKTKDSLSAFLPNLPGNIDTPASQDGSGLRSLIEKPPIGGKSIEPLSANQLVGFRLHPGSLPDHHRLLFHQPPKKHKKHKKNKQSKGETPSHDSLSEHGMGDSQSASHEKKKNKDKKKDEDKERKKKKKDKKKDKKKHKHSSDSGLPPGPGSSATGILPGPLA